jgi:hypothetical protein
MRDRKAIRAAACALLASVAASGAFADAWFFLPEPKFMEHQVSFGIVGAKGTVLAPAKIGEFGVEFPTVADWTAAGLNEDAVRSATWKLASEWLKHAKPELVRNSRKVVEYAVVRSDKVPVCVTVFAPEFRKQFEDVFGPRMMIVIPNRQTVFVFPGVAVNYSRYAPLIFDAWRSGAPKVSLEVFELSERGLKAIGKFEEP